MVYRYGSPINDGYDYVRFVREIAPHLPENDSVFLHNGSTNWRKNYSRIPRTLFLNVCYWKTTMRFDLVRENTSHAEVNKCWQMAIASLSKRPLDDHGVENALSELTRLNGIGVPRASALLTAWDPREFGIIDRKVARVLGLGKNLSKRRYLEFLHELRVLRSGYPELSHCALRQIELALWHYYALRDAGNRERRDD